MTFGTGREWKRNVPKIREREASGKKTPSPKFENGKGKNIPKFREQNGNKKSVRNIWEQESEAIIPGNSREWERQWKEEKMICLYKKYSENIWRGKEFWPQIFSTTPCSFFDIPHSYCRCHSRFQQQDDLIVTHYC